MDLSPLGPGRSRNGADALVVARRALLGRLPPRTDAWSYALAERLVLADDRYCRGRGLVVASDEIWRADLDAVLGVGLPVLTCGHTDGPHPDCPRCAMIMAWRRMLARLRSGSTAP